MAITLQLTFFGLVSLSLAQAITRTSTPPMGCERILPFEIFSYVLPICTMKVKSQRLVLQEVDDDIVLFPRCAIPQYPSAATNHPSNVYKGTHTTTTVAIPMKMSVKLAR